MTCDPTIYPHATPVPELSFDEAAELAYFGAQVGIILPFMFICFPLELACFLRWIACGTLRAVIYEYQEK